MFAHRRSVSSSWSLDLSHVAVVQSVNAMGVDLFQQGGEGGSKVSGARRLSGEPRHAAKATSGEDGARNNRRGMDGISNTVHPLGAWQPSDSIWIVPISRIAGASSSSGLDAGGRGAVLPPRPS